MKCPCCKNEMLMISDHHEVSYKPNDFEGRHYQTYLCNKGGQYCNGLIVKHDVYEEKRTYITPCHTTTTLHTNYVNSVSEDDLLKSIFTVFEWIAYHDEKEK